METKKFCLTERQMPTQWYNIVADMPNKPLPPLHPATKQPVTKEQMSAIFAEELIDQEMSTERFIDIPEEVQEIYKIWRPSPLVRATGLEKALGTPAKIYFKNESVSPAGSHKPNTAVPQAYYNYKQGIRHLTTETGAGQWGAAIAFAAKHFGLDVQVFMVKVSYEQKPYRRLMMNTWGAECIASPSTITASGRAALERDPDCSGSLGLAISEAVEMALQHPEDTRYCLGSVLNHVILHQTVIGQEAVAQMEMAGRGDRLLRRRQQFRRTGLPVPAQEPCRRQEYPHRGRRAVELPETHARHVPVRFRGCGRVHAAAADVYARA